jgi:cell wall-active antibiotic response 4TMS protein YvqF
MKVFALAALLATPLAAQQMRSYEYARPQAGERRLHAVIEFAAGRLDLRPAAPGRLYALSLSYDADRFRPIGRYDAKAGQVNLGVEGIGGGGIRVDRRKALPQDALIELPAGVELTLDASIGAAESILELGGLRLSALDLKTGASRTTINFASRTTGDCRTASVTSGAGELTVNSAGNSGCRSWRLEGGVGEVYLDLGGAWPADARITLNMALGGVTLAVPRDLGVRVRMSGFMSGFDAKGFEKVGKTYTSTNYGSTKRHIEIEVSSALGGVDLIWK